MSIATLTHSNYKQLKYQYIFLSMFIFTNLISFVGRQNNLSRNYNHISIIELRKSSYCLVKYCYFLRAFFEVIKYTTREDNTPTRNEAPST